MNARCLNLPAILVGLFAATWSPALGELPQAPAPRVKKTTAELLVGTWKLVKTRAMELPLDVEILIEFNRDGKFFARAKDRKNGLQKKTGTYTLSSDTIRLTSEANANEPAETWAIAIEAINDDELKTVAGSLHDRQRSVYKRTETKTK